MLSGTVVVIFVILLIPVGIFVRRYVRYGGEFRDSCLVELNTFNRSVHRVIQSSGAPASVIPLSDSIAQASSSSIKLGTRPFSLTSTNPRYNTVVGDVVRLVYGNTLAKTIDKQRDRLGNNETLAYEFLILTAVYAELLLRERYVEYRDRERILGIIFESFPDSFKAKISLPPMLLSHALRDWLSHLGKQKSPLRK